MPFSDEPDMLDFQLGQLPQGSPRLFPELHAYNRRWAACGIEEPGIMTVPSILPDSFATSNVNGSACNNSTAWDDEEKYSPAYVVDGGLVTADWKTLEPIAFYQWSEDKQFAYSDKGKKIQETNDAPTIKFEPASTGSVLQDTNERDYSGSAEGGYSGWSKEIYETVQYYSLVSSSGETIHDPGSAHTLIDNWSEWKTEPWQDPWGGGSNTELHVHHSETFTNNGPWGHVGYKFAPKGSMFLPAIIENTNNGIVKNWDDVYLNNNPPTEFMSSGGFDYVANFVVSSKVSSISNGRFSTSGTESSSTGTHLVDGMAVMKKKNKKLDGIDPENIGSYPKSLLFSDSVLLSCVTINVSPAYHASIIRFNIWDNNGSILAQNVIQDDQGDFRILGRRCDPVLTLVKYL